MKFTRDPILNDVIYIESKLFGDDRGYFFEAYNEKTFKEAGIHNNFVQDNQSFSQKNVLRGLHFQKAPKAQAKLVRVLSGKIFDVAVDIRPDSPTYKKYCAYYLDSDKQDQLFIPAGFAHGFIVCSDTASILYKCDNLYSPEHEGSIIWNDPSINIDWPLDGEVILSDKDKTAPFLS